MSAALSNGEQINDLLVIEPTTTLWNYYSYVKGNRTLEQIGQEFQHFVIRLEKAQVEYDLGSENIIKDRGSIKKGKFIIGQRGYSTVIIPPLVENIEKHTFDLLTDFVTVSYTHLDVYKRQFQSYFIVFDKTKTPTKNNNAKNFSNLAPLQQIEGEWNVSFDPRWGGPEEAVFPSLSDWSQNKDEGIKYYSGIATYKKIFNFNSKVNGERIYLHLGEVKNIARVKLNEKELGVVWTAPVSYTHLAGS